jgi:hypothetical protein
LPWAGILQAFGLKNAAIEIPLEFGEPKGPHPGRILLATPADLCGPSAPGQQFYG